MCENVWIANTALADMSYLADFQFPSETGGMLLGYQAENNECVVTEIIGPGPLAIHHRFGLVPDGEYQQAELEKIYSESNGQVTYLGDWHTHPKGLNRPSRLDKRTLSRIARESKSGTVTPLMAILGNGNPKWEVAVVRYLSESGFIFKNFNIIQLNPIFY